MRVKAAVVVAILILITTISTSAHATAILVNSAVDPSDPPRCTLHDAIVAANTGVAVNGCKAGSGNDSISFSSGSKITLKATLPTIERTLQINGRPNQPKTVISGNNAVQIMQIDTTAVVSLSNLTIQEGISDDTSGNSGGGVFNQGSLTINSCSFINNRATGFGGALLSVGSLNISNSSFANNSVVANTLGVGGAIVNVSSQPVSITNCTFISNSSSGGLVTYGGAIANSSLMPLTIRNSAFKGNSVSSENGAAYGGAFTNPGGGAVIVENTTFSSNSASTGTVFACGGAIGDVSFDITIVGDTFVGNIVSGGLGSTVVGGAVCNAGSGPVEILNSTFANNRALGNTASAVLGGGVLLDLTDSVFFSTLSNNNASNVGGPAATGGNFGSFGSSPLVANSILAGGGAAGNCEGSFTDGGYNISSDASCAFSTTGSRNNTNPQFSNNGLASNGGPTQTIALKSFSPAVDVIPNSACVDSNGDPVTTDQRGRPRPDPEDGPSGPCDIGAYEFQQPFK